MKYIFTPMQTFDVQKMKYLLGIDLGSSSIKIALIEKTSGNSIGTVQVPETEMSIDAKEKGWEIVTLGNRIYFRSFSKIYEYQNNVITPIDTPFSATDLFVFEESLYVAGDVAGIFTFLPLNNYLKYK